MKSTVLHHWQMLFWSQSDWLLENCSGIGGSSICWEFIAPYLPVARIEREEREWPHSVGHLCAVEILRYFIHTLEPVTAEKTCNIL